MSERPESIFTPRVIEHEEDKEFVPLTPENAHLKDQTREEELDFVELRADLEKLIVSIGHDLEKSLPPDAHLYDKRRRKKDERLFKLLPTILLALEEGKPIKEIAKIIPNEVTDGIGVTESRAFKILKDVHHFLRRHHRKMQH